MTSQFDSGSTAVELMTCPPVPISSLFTDPGFKTLLCMAILMLTLAFFPFSMNLGVEGSFEVFSCKIGSRYMES